MSKVKTAGQAFTAMRYTRNLQIRHIEDCPLLAATEPWHRNEPTNWAYEEWAKARRATQAFIALMRRPEDQQRAIPYHYAWTKNGLEQVFQKRIEPDADTITAEELHIPLRSNRQPAQGLGWPRNEDAVRALAEGAGLTGEGAAGPPSVIGPARRRSVFDSWPWRALMFVLGLVGGWYLLCLYLSGNWRG